MVQSKVARFLWPTVYIAIEWNPNRSSWTSQILEFDFWQAVIFYPTLALSLAEVLKNPSTC